MIKEIGDQSRLIVDGEMRYLEDALLHTDLTGHSPITTYGSTGFCEQQAWIQNGKFRENVIFGADFDQKKYVETIMSCQLETDLSIMPAGDLTEIGEKGINLSGGQKARLALARAIY
jgi:ABC-type bacteriocin/lantibiotic exporter with double-glycine peptidase domain